MKIMNPKNLLLMMVVLVTLLSGAVSQYYNNYDAYYRRILPYWRQSFRRESPPQALYGRQSRSRSYRQSRPVSTNDEDYDIWPVSMF